MNPPPPGRFDPAETTQAVPAPGRPASNDVRGAGKWLTIVALGVAIAGFAVYRLMLGDGQDNYGTLFFPIAAVTVGIAGPLGLIGIAMWLTGAARARRSGGGS